MIVTDRLDLIPATAELVRAELRSPAELARELAVNEPRRWPPELYGEEATRWTLEQLERDASGKGWWLHYFLLRGHGTGPPHLIGCGGYKGPPADGDVEIGYSVLPEFQRRGLATEATMGLVRNAFRAPDVQRVLADTLPHLRASIGVLARCGFRPLADGPGPDVIRFELRQTLEMQQ